MNDSIANLFADKNYCLEELMRLRDSISTRPLTNKVFDAAYKTLGFMILHCPKEIYSLVQSQLEETGKRHTLCLTHGMIES